MTIINHILSGAGRSARTWKWIIVSWFVTLLSIALVVYPFRSGIAKMLGSSMITERLQNGFNVEVMANSGTGVALLSSFLTSGILLLIVAGFLMNVFFSGGFFEVLRRKPGDAPARGFFGASASSFWSYLVISILVRLMINLISFLIIGLPLIILSSNGSSENVVKIIMITGGIFFLILPVFLLITDYARAWQAASPRKDAISALGNGFRYTFRYFFSSWFMMLLIVAIQTLFTVFVLMLISRMRPDTGPGIMLVFILSQILFMVKIYLRTWRYGIITSKFEAHSS